MDPTTEFAARLVCALEEMSIQDRCVIFGRVTTVVLAELPAETRKRWFAGFQIRLATAIANREDPYFETDPMKIS